LISEAAGQHFFMIHKAVRRALLFHNYRRVETAVASDFEQGHRWMSMLGFEREGRMRAFTPDGRDCDLYARVQ
jgi:RimJ/RimL family protein N-acetyltransferase